MGSFQLHLFTKLRLCYRMKKGMLHSGGKLSGKLLGNIWFDFNPRIRNGKQVKYIRLEINVI
jgi:hypothetical protein